VHCTSYYCAWPLYEVVLNQYVLSYASDKEKYHRAVILYFVKMELWLFCTALPFNVLDNCMKLYWIPNSSFQVMLWTRKMQRTSGPTNQPTTGWLLYTPPPNFVFGDIIIIILQ
jgi:hypothetical protein